MERFMNDDESEDFSLDEDEVRTVLDRYNKVMPFYAPSLQTYHVQISLGIHPQIGHPSQSLFIA